MKGAALLILAVVLAGATSACSLQPKKPQPLVTATPKAAIDRHKQIHQQALDRAQRWHDNALLQRVYRVYEGSLQPADPPPVVYEFSSLADPMHLMRYEVRQGQLTEVRVNARIEDQQVPIELVNWRVDVDTALQNAEAAGGKAFHERHLAGYKVTQQLLKNKQFPLQWQVLYDSGDGSRRRHTVIIDATTGVVVSQKEAARP